VAVRIALLLIATGLFTAGGYFIAVTPPTRDSIYPKCVAHQLTGLYCPGCGTGRATHFLLLGRPLTALKYNLFAPIVLPILVFVGARALVGWALGREAPERRLARPLWPWLLVAALLAYGVARNIPVEPFSNLAPQELEPASESGTASS
jgi:hypothetical protein